MGVEGVEGDGGEGGGRGRGRGEIHVGLRVRGGRQGEGRTLRFWVTLLAFWGVLSLSLPLFVALFFSCVLLDCRGRWGAAATP